MLFHAPHDKDDAENSSLTPYLLSEHNTDQELPSHVQRTYYHPGWYQLRHQGEVQVQGDRICLKRSQTGGSLEANILSLAEQTH